MDGSLKTTPIKAIERIISQSVGQNSRVTLENDVDDDIFPMDFVYTQENVLRDSAEAFSKRPQKCCPCPNRCKFGANCANKWLNHYQPKLPRNVVHGLSCTCDKSCRYCLLEKGSHVDVCIFKTPHTGWGVRANKKIAKGEFIEAYTGSVVLRQNARCEVSELNWYRFNLDDWCNIDARYFGNFTRFINHSCDPNVAGVQLRTGLDAAVPGHVSFHAMKDIDVGEELTLHYHYKVADVRRPSVCVRCNCGSARCTGYLARY